MQRIQDYKDHLQNYKTIIPIFYERGEIEKLKNVISREEYQLKQVRQQTQQLSSSGKRKKNLKIRKSKKHKKGRKSRNINFK